MTTLGTNVKLIDESLVYGETLADYTKRVDYALPMSYQESQIPKLGDSYPGDTAPWGYIVTETGSKTTHSGPHRGAYITGVVYTKAKIPFESGIAGAYEIERSKQTGRRSRRMGTRVFLTADSEADTIAETYLKEGTPMEEGGEWSFALLREKNIERRWRVGIAKITAVYDTYSQRGDILAIGQGILECDATTTMMWNHYQVDEDGNTIDKPFTTTAGERRQWALVQGDNGMPVVRAALRIRVLLLDSHLPDLCDLVGQVNSKSCPNILDGVAAKTLWFNALSMRQRQYGQSNLHDTVISLLYDPAGWDTNNVIELQEYVTKKQTVLQSGSSTTASGDDVTVKVWETVAGTDQETLRYWTESDFKLINDYLK